MRMSIWDRILVILTALIDIAMTALMGLRMFALDLFGDFMLGLQTSAPYNKYLIFAFLALVIVLNVMVIVFMFRHQSAKRAERRFVVVDAGEKGRIRIAMDALEGMVRHASDSLESAHNVEIHVQNQEDAIAIGLDMDLEMGVHVPTVTLNLQRDIREYVETNCGIAVRTVSIDVHNLIQPTRTMPEFADEPTGPIQPIVSEEQPTEYAQSIAEEQPVQTEQPIEESVEENAEEPQTEQE